MNLGEDRSQRRLLARRLTRAQNTLLAALFYPYTILEVGAMALGTLLLVLSWRVRYSSVLFLDEKRKTDKYAKRESTMDGDLAVLAMEHVENLAAVTGAKPYWISGTLLGLERIGKPLPHDYDLDLGIDASDPSLDALIKALLASPQFQNLSARFHGFKRRVQNPDLSAIAEGLLRYTLEYKASANSKPVMIDLFLHYPYGTKTIHLSRYTIWWNTPFSIEKQRFGAKLFSVPSDRRKHLKENYGDFTVEQKDFENSIDCPNVYDIYSWDSLIYLLRRRKLMIKIGRVDKEKMVAKRIWRTIFKGLWPRIQIR